jgi:uncharacterized protein YggT (Ycf19 family)
LTIEPMQIEKSEVGWAHHAILWFSRAIAMVVKLYVLAVEVILLMGFILLLGGANPSSSFVEWVYRSMDRAMKPFRGIFAPIDLGTTGNDVEAIFETSVLFAMIVYGILAIAISALLGWLNSLAAKQARRDEEYRRQQIIGQVVAGTDPLQQPTISPGAPTTAPGVPTTPPTPPTPPAPAG